MTHAIRSIPTPLEEIMANQPHITRSGVARFATLAKAGSVSWTSPRRHVPIPIR